MGVYNTNGTQNAKETHKVFVSCWFTATPDFFTCMHELGSFFIFPPTKFVIDLFYGKNGGSSVVIESGV